MAARSLVRALKILLFVTLTVSVFNSPFSSSQESSSGKPELHPTTLILDPASPVDQGRLVNVLVKFENSGEVAAAEFNVEFFIRLRPEGEDPPSWDSFAIVQRRGLSPDEQEVQVAAVLDTSNRSLVPAPGVYEIRVVVDSNDQIPESDETNNELIVSLLVRPSKLGKPDLRPQTLTFEPRSPIQPGDMVFVTATILNTGDKDAGPFDVSFAYCRITERQTACPTEFIEFGRQSFPGGLPKSSALEAAAALQSLELGLAPGIYLIKVSADPPNPDNTFGLIEEQDEANNELIAVLSIQGPELHPTSISFNPPLPRAGDTVKVTAIVENSGQGVARNVAVAFFVDGAEFARPTVTLEEGGKALVEGFLRTANLNLGVGIHLIQITVDPNNQIAERDETNNELRTALTLQTPQPRQPELHPKSLVVNPRSPVELNRNLALTIYSEAVNSGEIAARGFQIAFFYRLTGSVRWIPLPCTTNCTVAELAPGTGIVAEGKLNLVGIAAGNYEVRVLVDPPDAQNRDGQVKELDESNNEMKSAVTLLIARKPDLIIDPLSLRVDPALEIRRGTTVIISADVVNIGEQAAGLFTVEFCLRRLDEQVQVCTVFARQEVSGLGINERARLQAKLDTTNLRPGFYELQIVADPEDRVAELSEVNNSFITGLDPRGALFVRGPDLVVLSFQIPQLATSPAIPAVPRGQQLQVVAQITNIGVEATGAFEVEFCRQLVGETSCVPFGQRTSFPGLGIGVVVQAQATLDTANLAGGSYVLQVVVDPTAQGKPSGQVEEENEQNNIAFLPLEVLGPGGAPVGDGADLTVLGLTLTPEKAKFGEIVQVRAEVANTGRAGAGPFRVVFFWQKIVGTSKQKEVNFAYANLSSLASGARQFVTVELDTSLLFRGRFDVIIIVDYNNDVRELNEDNNRTTKELRVD